MTDATTTPTSEPTPPETAQPSESEAQSVAVVIDKLNSENAELKDRLLRALADLENIRRRGEREVADARTYAVTAFARDLLTVADNLSRALENLPTDVHADGAFRTFAEGVEITARELQAALGRHGVKKMEPTGEKFDPNFHQAIYETPDATLPVGTVSQVVQSGWTIGERVLRPALVSVSKGGPRRPANPESKDA